MRRQIVLMVYVIEIYVCSKKNKVLCHAPFTTIKFVRVNYPFIDSNIPESSAQGVYISRLMLLPGLA